jgi:hypothetical protein
MAAQEQGLQRLRLVSAGLEGFLRRVVLKW